MTTESWSRQRSDAAEATKLLHELLTDGDVSDRRLIAGYLEAKRVLAAAFEALALERYSDPSLLEDVKTALEVRMRERFPDLPEKYKRIRGFGRTHALLVAYLVPRAETNVSAAELRMLTGDQVHTERRARELRDLGFALDARESAGMDMYWLQSTSPDLELGARLQATRNVREDKSLSPSETQELLALVREG